MMADIFESLSDALFQMRVVGPASFECAVVFFFGGASDKNDVVYETNVWD